MLSSIKRIFITLFILTVVAISGIYFYTKGRTYYNEDSEIGNTSGNIYNGGLFCQQDETIYFSNNSDGGRLYRMTLDCTNITKVSDEKAVYLNVDENYIYYARANDTTQYNPDFYSIFDNTGVYRLNYNGKGLKAITGDPSAFIILKGNYLFFERYKVKTGFNLTRFKIDGSMERILLDYSAIPINYANNYIYYNKTSEGANINAMELASFTEKTYYSGDFVYPIFMGDYIYYIDRADNNQIYRMNSDGSGKTLLVNKPCSTYNITNSRKYLYYQVHGTKNDLIGRINLETLETETVKEGNYKEISVTEFYVFFKSINKNKTYMTLADQSVNVKTLQTDPQLTPTGSP